MSVLDKVRGVFKKMIAPKTLEEVLNVTPIISETMRKSIEGWAALYQGKPPYLSDDLKTLNLASMIASEKARTATIEMEVKITGESKLAEQLKMDFKKVERNIRKWLELSIALGSGVIRPYVVPTVDGKYKLDMVFTKATDVYPLSFSASGDLLEVVFVEKIINKKQTFSKLEHQVLQGTEVIVTNKAFLKESSGPTDKTDLGKEINLTEVPQWANISPQTKIENVDCLLFAYFTMPEINTEDLDSPLGASGFSKATDLIKHADEMYSNLLWEFEGGQLAIDVDSTATNLINSGKGRYIQELPKLQERLFRHDLDLGTDEFYNVFSPQLRDVSIINGLNNVLMRIEDVVSISRGTISEVVGTEAKTATELRILKQRSYSANEDIQLSLQTTLEQLLKVMSKFYELYKIVPSGEYEVSFKWDDSIITDKDSERQVDLMEINAKIQSKLEYRQKWHGETEDQALESLERINEESLESMKIQQELLMQQPMNNKETTPEGGKKEPDNEPETKQKALEKANASLEFKKPE